MRINSTHKQACTPKKAYFVGLNRLENSRPRQSIQKSESEAEVEDLQRLRDIISQLRRQNSIERPPGKLAFLNIVVDEEAEEMERGLFRAKYI